MKLSNVRISHLKRDRAEREAAFTKSRLTLEKSVREWTNPLRFIRDNPGFMSKSGHFLMSILGLANGVDGQNGNGKPVSGIQRWGLKLASVGVTIATRSLRPFGALAVQFAMKKILRRFQA